MFVIGIDGGGTKTIAILVSSTGEIVAQATGGTSNPNAIGIDEAKNEILKLVLSLSIQNQKAYKNVVSVFAGLSGIESPKYKEEMKQILQNQLPEIAVTIDNDAVIALFSGTFGEPGVVQISGTGSVTYGLDSKGNRHRVGGWGYLIGDEGSGYAIGRAGLHAAFLEKDNRGPSTEISNLLLEYFQVKQVDSMIPLIYGEKARTTIASLSKIVMLAADHSDQVALEIIKYQSQQLGEQITALIQVSTFQLEGKIPVVLTGGVMNRSDLLLNDIVKTLKDHGINQVEVTVPKLPPVAGAVIAAFQAVNKNLDKISFQDRFLEGYV
ncbi:hypothetical protein BTS2_0636 [Bacillus sp. TS-2]|nr:hypothetical protein BTS2_0636 [Bacillus sp. TS-2]